MNKYNNMNDYSNRFAPWSINEETLLLEELKNNICFETIAKNHKRTIGAIHARRRKIAYNMYINKIPIEEISKKIKFDIGYITRIIRRRGEIVIKNDIHISNNNNTSNITNTNLIELQNDIKKIKKIGKKIKNDIREIKNIIERFTEMMKKFNEMVDM